MKTIILALGAILLLTLEFYIGYELGYKKAKTEANQRAKEMILNDEIPNYYLEVETVDYLINDGSGELQKCLK